MNQLFKQKRKKSPSGLILGITTLASTLLITSCQANRNEGLKIGSLLPKTGDLASIGQNLGVAIELAVETINNCGGVNGDPVTLINQDSQTDPSAASAAMTKLTEVDRVAGVVGAFASSVSSSAVKIAARNRVMMISPGSTSPVFTEGAKQGSYQGYWARTASPDTYQAKALAALARQQGLNRVATVAINNDYGVGFEREFVSAFQKLGGTVINDSQPVRYDPKASTLDTEARAALNGKPDGLIALLYIESGSLLLKSAFEQGLTEGVQILLTDGVYSQDFPKLVGEDSSGKSILTGALGTSAGADGAALSEFTSLWKKKTGENWTVYVPQTWDATVLMMLAAQASGENTGDGIKSKLREVANAPGKEVSDPCQAMELIRNGEEINYQGASGDVDIDRYGDVVSIFDVWRIKEDGSLETIDQVKPAD
ncbi:MAG: ABC transporter substrate-binding protein [Prochloraceae cyanobacterium]|nr:ABC transporter substrate-binding protein [Prochloraceae cyanobacterium]